MLKRASDLEAEAKRIRLAESFYPLLDLDLNRWKDNLAANLNPKGVGSDAWQLVFFSDDDQTGLQSFMRSYGSSPHRTQPWSAIKWHQSAQNSGGYIIATGPTSESLMPPTVEAAKRLFLFGFTFVVCPKGTILPYRTRELDSDPSIAGYVYYNPYPRNPAMLREQLLDFDLNTPKDVDKLYQTCKPRSDLHLLHEELTDLRKKFSQDEARILKQIAALEKDWSYRFI